MGMPIPMPGLRDPAPHRKRRRGDAAAAAAATAATAAAAAARAGSLRSLMAEADALDRDFLARAQRAGADAPAPAAIVAFPGSPGSSSAAAGGGRGGRGSSSLSPSLSRSASGSSSGPDSPPVRRATRVLRARGRAGLARRAAARAAAGGGGGGRRRVAARLVPRDLLGAAGRQRHRQAGAARALPAVDYAAVRSVGDYYAARGLQPRGRLDVARAGGGRGGGGGVLQVLFVDEAGAPDVARWWSLGARDCGASPMAVFQLLMDVLAEVAAVERVRITRLVLCDGIEHDPPVQRAVMLLRSQGGPAPPTPLPAPYPRAAHPAQRTPSPTRPPMVVDDDDDDPDVDPPLLFMREAVFLSSSPRSARAPWYAMDSPVFDEEVAPAALCSGSFAHPITGDDILIELE